MKSYLNQLSRLPLIGFSLVFILSIKVPQDFALKIITLPTAEIVFLLYLIIAMLALFICLFFPNVRFSLRQANS